MDESRPKGFTLIELLVVIAIIGILIARLLPAVQSAREQARLMTCQNNLKQLGLAMQLYHETHGTLPYRHPSGFSTGRGGTWAALILPFMEQQTVYDLFDFNQQLSHPNNHRAVTRPIQTYVCPSDSTADKPLQGGRNCQIQRWNACEAMGMWYPACMGPTQDGTRPSNACVFCEPSNPSYCCQGYDYGRGGTETFAGMFGQSAASIAFKNVADGMSQTIMAGETIPRHCSFNGAYSTNFPIAGTSIPLNTMIENDSNIDDKWYSACGYKSEHPSGVNFVMADGSVHFLPEAMDYRTYNELGSRAGGELAKLP